MFSISHHISKQDQIHQMEREFTKHSMERLSLPNITDESGPALLRMFRGLGLSPSSDAEEKKVWKLDDESMSIQMPEHFGLFPPENSSTDPQANHLQSDT